MKKRDTPTIDGWGLIIIIIGLALIFMGDTSGNKNAGIIIFAMGLIRTIYMLVKYGS